jgi:hypothetical protein
MPLRRPAPSPYVTIRDLRWVSLVGLGCRSSPVAGWDSRIGGDGGLSSASKTSSYFQDRTLERWRLLLEIWSFSFRSAASFSPVSWESERGRVWALGTSR